MLPWKLGDVSQHSRHLLNAGMCNIAGKATRAEGNTEVEAAKVLLVSRLSLRLQRPVAVFHILPFLSRPRDTLRVLATLWPEASRRTLPRSQATIRKRPKVLRLLCQ